MKIITISREFGSGGRELGKRLADHLGFAYYDREIITAIAEKKGMDTGYVERALNGGWTSIPLTFRHTFATPMLYQGVPTELLLEQKRVIEEIAKAGRDCIIVGRNADVLLKDYHPFNIFVCADMEARLRRCTEHARPDENIAPKKMEQMIRRVDENRIRTREIITGDRWGDARSYHLVVNTTGWVIKELTPVVADFALRWFDKSP